MNPLKALCEWWCRMPEPGLRLDAAQLAESDKRRDAVLRHGSGDPSVRYNMLRGTSTEHREDTE